MTRRKKYQLYLRSAKWKSKRKARIFQDSGQCVFCGSRHKLEVHHKTYQRFGNEQLNDLVTLCEACHKKTHDQTSLRITSRRVFRRPE